MKIRNLISIQLRLGYFIPPFTFASKTHASEPVRTTVVDTPYRGCVLCLMWWIRHTEAGYYANVVGYYACCGGYAIQRRGIMLT